MDKAIATLKELPGVFGVCVYDADQRLIVNRMPPFFPAETLASLGALLADISSLAREKLSRASDLTLHYDEVSLIVRTLTDKTILVLGEPHMNERLVSYSLNLLGKPKTAVEPKGAEIAASKPATQPTTTANFISVYVADLKLALAKIVGPMADIIFDDAMEQWHQQGETPFGNLLLILREEINDQGQFERYLAITKKTVAEIQAWERSHG